MEKGELLTHGNVELHASVQLILRTVFALVRYGRALFTIAYHFNLRARCAVHDEIVEDTIGTTFTDAISPLSSYVYVIVSSPSS